MFSLMIQKLLHKKWMVLCILIGNILLIAVAVSHPMYRSSSFQRMLTDEFDKYLEETGKWPTEFKVSQNTIKGAATSQISDLQTTVDQVVNQVGIALKEQVRQYEMASAKATAKVVRDKAEEKRMQISCYTDMEEHIQIVAGEMPKEQATEDGCYEVMVSEAAVIRQDLLLGDEFLFKTVKSNDGNPIAIRIVGVFRPTDSTEIYWVMPASKLETQVFLKEETFNNLFMQEGKEILNSMKTEWYILWDYKQISASEVTKHLGNYEKAVSNETLKGKADARVFKSIVTSYSEKAKRVEATLAILQIPVLLLLCAFLYMISGQMLQMEQNEISLMKSRGATRGQIVRLYLMQSGFLTFISLFIGLPIGRGICSFLGSSTAFLEFTGKRALPIRFNADILLYGGGAMMIAIAMTTIPVIKYSGVSIVNLKQSQNQNKKSLWKKIYLDIICLAISFYGYFSFRKNEQTMMENVLAGKSLDPLLYISFSLFILGCGLLICRLHPLIMKLIFKASERWLQPAAYASILETIRAGYKQEFIILFMILTVAIGISNATMARTILANTTANIFHTTGANLVVEEVWPNNQAMVNNGLADKLEYYEPDYGKFQIIPGVEQSTKVLKKGVNVSRGPDSIKTTLLGIQTKSFAEVTKMRDGLLPFDYYEYLNVLASNREGVLVSENFMSIQGYKLGESIVFKDKNGKSMVGYIKGFFNYWPGYQPIEYRLNENGTLLNIDHYMIVGNLTTLQGSMGVVPYQVWMKVNDNGARFEEWRTKNPDVSLSKVQNIEQLLTKAVEDTLIQGTNGILSMSFIVVLILCCVGYLIYWIMSIRSRELLFGVLRAMGMRKKEITWMLVIEQICSGLFAIVMGGIIGAISSIMFVPMIQKVYAAADQVLPMEMAASAKDIVQLFIVIGAMLFVCLFVLGKIISRMNISNALKLGED